MIKVLFASLLVLITGCSHVGWDTTKLGSPVTAYQFNDLLDKYSDRPTFAQIVTYKSGKSYLSIQMDAYGSKTHEHRFIKENVKLYVEYIDKFLEWEKLAEERHDMFNKKIGNAKGFAVNITFSFISGSKYHHYLQLSAMGINEQLYTRSQANKLRQLLIDYENNAIDKPDINAIYQ